jgi:CHAT domain-containing protein/Tfp pilus assembly protein PilF
MKKISCYVFFLLGCHSMLAQEVPALYKQLEESYNNSDFDACLKLEPQVEAFAAGRIDTLASNSLFYIGYAYQELGNINKAISFYEREKNLVAKLPNRDDEAYSASIYNLASIYLEAGKYEKAGIAADELLTNDKKIYSQSSPQFVASAINIADIYIQLDRFKEAEHVLLSTLKHQEKNSLNEGTLLNKLGDFYTYTGQYAKASKALERATDVLFDVAGEDSGEYMMAAINLGILYMGQGKYPEAEEVFEVALNLISPETNPVNYNSLLNNMSLVYQSLGQFEKSEDVLNKIKALDSISIGINHPDYAITMSNLGQVLCDEGKYKEAESALLKALDILKRNNESNSVAYARKLNGLSRVYMLSGQPSKAIRLLEQSLVIFKKNLGENNPEFASTTYLAGNAYWKGGQNATAIKYLKQSATIRAKVLGKKHPKYAESIQKIAEYQWFQKQVEDAHKSFGEVFDNFYFQIDATFPGLTEEEKTKFFYTNIKDSFEKFNSFAVAFSKDHPLLLGDLYNYQVNTKGAIMYATEKVRQIILGSNDTTLIRTFETWQSQKESIARAYSQNHDIKKVDSLVESANKLEKELTRRSADFAKQFVRKKYTWQDIQKVLRQGEAAVEVLRFKKYSPDAAGSFTKDVTYAFLIITPETKEHPLVVLMDKGNDLENKYLKFYHNSIKYTLDDVYSYKNLFQPLADELRKHGISKFYFSPDGIYNQVNINTIQNPETKTYLLDEFDIQMLTNTKELVEPQQMNALAQNPVLIGFPKFNLTKATDGSTSDVPKSRGVSRGVNRGMTRGMRGILRLVQGSGGISELPGTQKEIDQISKLFTSKPQIYLETEATESIVKHVDKPAYLHIATHGYFLEDDEPNSSTQYVTNPLLKAGLILAGAENFLTTGDPINDAGDDGILTAYEAMNLRLDNTRLVVLSACETGLGHVKNGEGVYGLQRALKLAGTQSIVMSLWNVDDDATQELMSTFYQELIRTGDQHASFRTAQQKIKAKYEKPFYWGAFIMVGI